MGEHEKSEIDPDLKALRTELAKADHFMLGELMSSMLKWTLTTLLVLNSGGLAALVGSEDFRPLVFGWAGWLFVSGAVLAMFGALALIFAFARGGQSSFKAMWDGEIFDQSFEEFYSSTVVHGAALLGATLYGLSLTAFILGCVSVAGSELHT